MERTIKKKKKIAFLLGQMCNGGAERVISNLSMGLLTNYEVYTILLKQSSDVDYPLRGIVETIDDGKKRNKYGMLLYHIKEIKKIIKKNNIDTVISFMEYPNVLNLLIPLKIRKIVSVRNFMSKKWKGRSGLIWKCSIRLLYPKANLIVSPASAIEKDLIDNYGIDKRISRVINNPYKINELLNSANATIEKRYGQWFNGKTIITMGRLSRQKGQCFLLRSFALLKKQIPGAKLIILGQGEFETKLKELAKTLDIDKDVLFLGFQTNPHRYIKRSNLFVLSSLFEGFPNALVEAMACGVPVISTDCKSGPREILAPTTDFSIETKRIEQAQYGVIVPNFDIEWIKAKEDFTSSETLLADAIRMLLENEQLRNDYTHKSLQRASEFTIGNIIKEWNNII